MIDYGSLCLFVFGGSTTEKVCFGRAVSCPDAFDIVAFSNQMKAIFGSCVIELIIV